MIKIGTSVKLLNNHPHSGEKGIVIGYDMILGKNSHKIKLSNCKHGSEECFVLNLKDLEII